ncbi:hypothetical protein L914_10260, partial [Phytophthora nicotianae]
RFAKSWPFILDKSAVTQLYYGRLEIHAPLNRLVLDHVISSHSSGDGRRVAIATSPAVQHESEHIRKLIHDSGFDRLGHQPHVLRQRIL